MKALVLPAKGLASHSGTRQGGLAPTASANAGTHSAIGAGSSSTTLYTPGAPRSSAAMVAPAASSTWMNGKTPVPSPTTGNDRHLNARASFVPRVYQVPGP